MPLSFPVAECLSLDEAIGQIAMASAGAIDQLPRRVSEILCHCADLESFLQPEQCVGSDATYTRHLLHADPMGRFSVVALVWHAGQQTPIHAHYTWCAYRIFEGCLTESRYAWDAAAAKARHVETVERHVGDTGFGHAGYEQIHQLGNRGRAKAISIHVYGIDGGRVSSHVNRLADVV